jgi:hypothetical protein
VKVLSFLLVATFLFGFLGFSKQFGNPDRVHRRKIMSDCHIVFVNEWTEEHQIIVLKAVERTGIALARMTLAEDSACEAFSAVYRTSMDTPFEFHWKGGQKQGGYTFGRRVIGIYNFFSHTQSSWRERSEHMVVHELGHAFSIAIWEMTGYRWPAIVLLKTQLYNPRFPDRKADDSGVVANVDWGYAGLRWDWQQSCSETPEEEWADMFLGWVYGKWAKNHNGKLREAFMNIHIPSWVSLIVNDFPIMVGN